MDATTDLCDWTSVDGTVIAQFGNPEPGVCNIYNFASHQQHEGHGRRALQELRNTYSCIRAFCVGDETNANRKFWLAMAHEGLVDAVFDFYGQQIWPTC